MRLRASVVARSRIAEINAADIPLRHVLIESNQIRTVFSLGSPIALEYSVKSALISLVTTARQLVAGCTPFELSNPAGKK
jgi:hypothetical protein